MKTYGDEAYLGEKVVREKEYLSAMTAINVGEL